MSQEAMEAIEHGAPKRVGVTPSNDKQRHRTKAREDALGYLLMLPIIMVMSVLVFLPLVIVFWDSLHNKTFTSPTYDFIGLGNYGHLLTSGDFWGTIFRTFLWTFVSVLMQIVVGLALAMLLNVHFKGRAFYRGLFLLPWVIPVVVVVEIWKWMMNDLYGVINFALSKIYGPWGSLAWFSSHGLAMPTLIGINVWRGAPFVMVILLAGLQTVPKDLIEAAAIDGASGRQQFWYVTLPHLRNVLMIVILVFTLFNFNNFDLIFLTTQGGPVNMTMTLPVQTYETAFKGLQVGESSAIAAMMLLLLIGMSAVYLRATRAGSSAER
jgi:multiple sugar transport system permease protein